MIFRNFYDAFSLMNKVLALSTIRNATNITLNCFLLGIEFVKRQDVSAYFFILNYDFTFNDTFNLLIHKFRMDISAHGSWFVN